MSLKAHVIQHIEFEDLGNLRGELERLGFEISYFRAHSESDLRHYGSDNTGHSDRAGWTDWSIR